jgi:hypothetical protein
LTHDGHTVTLDLTIEGTGLTAADLSDLPQDSRDLLPLDRAARVAMVRDSNSGDEDAAATLYLSHHQSEFDTEELLRLFGTSTPSMADPAEMLSRLILVRVGLYPEDDDRRVLLDYSIDPNVTDYLLCVSFNAEGEPVAVDLES